MHDFNQKPQNRSVRRHHIARIKRNRRFYHGMDLSKHPEALARAVCTPAACSCFMCGNPRKYLGERTIQEQKQIAAFDQIKNTILFGG